MTDGVKSGIGAAASLVGEAIVKPVVDEVGKAIEEGAQTTFGSSNPAQHQPKAETEEEQKRKQRAIEVIEWHRKIEEAQKQERERKKQQLLAQQQTEQQDKQKEQFEVVEKQQKNKQLTQVQIEATKAERKGGLGG